MVIVRKKTPGADQYDVDGESIVISGRVRIKNETWNRLRELYSDRINPFIKEREYIVSVEKSRFLKPSPLAEPGGNESSGDDTVSADEAKEDGNQD